QLRDRVLGYRGGGVYVDDHLDAARIARIDAHVDDTADADPEVAHRRAPIEAAHAAGEVDLVAIVVAMLAGVGIPVDEQHAEQAHEQHEGPDRRVVRLTLHAR